MADIFDEVSEELKQDQLLQIWKKYSKYIITFLVFIILTIFSYQAYISWEKKKLTLSSEEYFSALEMLENNKFLESEKIFLKNSTEQASGYKLLSLFGLAESNFKNGNLRNMISNYEAIYNNDKYDSHYRQLARMLSVIKDNASSYEDLYNRLKPLLNSPTNLQIIASELEMVLNIRFNKKKEANDLFKKLFNRSDISFEQKNRIKLINEIYNAKIK